MTKLISWKKALGITKVKRSISKATGIPLTKSGRKNKRNRTISKLLGFK